MMGLVFCLLFLAFVDLVLLTYIMHQRVIIKRLARAPASLPARAALAWRVAGGATADAQSALMNLGYTRLQAAAAVNAAIDQPNPPTDLDGILRACLAANRNVTEGRSDVSFTSRGN